MRNSRRTVIGFTTALAVGTFALPALAGLSDASGLTATGGAAGLTSPAAKSLPLIVGRLIGYALGLLGMIFVVLVIYAGFLWMTAQGNDEKVKQAKKTLSGAVIGLVIIFSADAILNFVIDALTASLKN